MSETDEIDWGKMNPVGCEESRCRYASADIVAIYASGNESQN